MGESALGDQPGDDMLGSKINLKYLHHHYYHYCYHQSITISPSPLPSPSVHHHYRHHQSITINVTFTNNATIIIITWIHSGVSVRPDTGDLRFIVNLITDTFCMNVPHFTITLFPKTLDTTLPLQAHCANGPVNKLISSN